MQERDWIRRGPVYALSDCICDLRGEIMTTTELIAFLKKYEFGGATGRPREVYICADGKIYDTEIKSFTTGDGLITELYIDLGEVEEE